MNLVSIIIPIYNVEKYIIKCIHSVINQTYPNIEILLIDDCSPDSSIQLVKDFIQNENINIPIYFFHHENNKGLSESRNTGIKNAKGEYIYFLDSDDWISPNCIDTLLKSALNNNSDVTIGSTICFLEDEKIEKMIFPLRNTTSTILNQDKIFEAFINHQWPVISPNKLYKVAFLKANKLKFKPNLLGEDELWAFEWAKCAEKISFVNENTYYYLLRNGSIISSKTKKNFEDMFIILNEFNSHYIKESNQLKKRFILKHILYYKEMLLIMQYKSIPSDTKSLYDNYKKFKQFPSLNFIDYFSKHYSFLEKKKNFLFHLPAFTGVPFFIWRYKR